MPFDVFYEAMTKGAETKSFQVNVAEFEAYFESFLKEGKDILHLCLSSGITGVMNSANIAKDILAEKVSRTENFDIVDSLSASSGYGLLMDKLADLRDAGMGIDELRQWVEENKRKVQHWFSLQI